MTVKKKTRLTSYNFWVRIVSAVVLILRIVLAKFGINIDSAFILDIATLVAGFLVVIGIINEPTGITISYKNESGDNMVNKKQIKTQIDEKLKEVEQIFAGFGITDKTVVAESLQKIDDFLVALLQNELKGIESMQTELEKIGDGVDVNENQNGDDLDYIFDGNDNLEKANVEQKAVTKVNESDNLEEGQNASGLVCAVDDNINLEETETELKSKTRTDTEEAEGGQATKLENFKDQTLNSKNTLIAEIEAMDKQTADTEEREKTVLKNQSQNYINEVENIIETINDEIALNSETEIKDIRADNEIGNESAKIDEIEETDDVTTEIKNENLNPKFANTELENIGAEMENTSTELENVNSEQSNANSLPKNVNAETIKTEKASVDIKLETAKMGKVSEDIKPETAKMGKVSVDIKPETAKTEIENVNVEAENVSPESLDTEHVSSALQTIVVQSEIKPDANHNGTIFELINNLQNEVCGNDQTKRADFCNRILNILENNLDNLV